MTTITLTEDEKEVVGLRAKELDENRDLFPQNPPLITFEQLRELLGEECYRVAEKFMAADPAEYGFKGPKLGVKEVPIDPVKVEGQIYIEGQEVKDLPAPFVSQTTFAQFQKMSKQVEKDLERPLLVASGYRSPAYQMYLFLYYLWYLKFDYPNVFNRVALPGYSEHGDGERHAIDVMTVYGSPSNPRPTDFEYTQEYAWLTKNAQSYGFVLTYPKDNLHGVMFEPWHWRLSKKLEQAL